MKPKSPVVEGTESHEVLVAEHQPQYMPLPALIVRGRSGELDRITSRWELSEDERELVSRGADLLVEVMFRGDVPPMRITVAEEEQ